MSSDGDEAVVAADGPFTLAFVGYADEAAGSRASAFEDAVLPLLADHGAEVLYRGTRVEGQDPALPHEVHLLWFPHRRSFRAYLADERRLTAIEQHGEVFTAKHTVELASGDTSRSPAGRGPRGVAVPQGERPHWAAEHRQRVDELVDEYRVALHDSLDDLTEDEARRRLVPSRTTLLGLVKHATYVEGVWFDQAITGRSHADVGIARTVDGSFALREGDTIATVQAAYRERWETSRRNLAGLRSDDVVDGRGARPVWALHLQVLRDLAQHAGHADILREQILASRGP